MDIQTSGRYFHLKIKPVVNKGQCSSNAIRLVDNDLGLMENYKNLYRRRRNNFIN